jgi:hypothetical protein
LIAHILNHIIRKTKVWKMSNNRIGFFDFLLIGAMATTVAFVILRIAGVISWAWWWLVSPLWIWFLMFCVFVVVMAALTLVVIAVTEDKHGKE